MMHYWTDIFNHSLTAGYYPDIYKRATMSIIQNPGTAGTAVNNNLDKQPISLLNVDGKQFDEFWTDD